MTTQAINSGQINKTSFPGSEAGASLVELVGTVLVVCSVSSIGMQLTCSAATVASATPGQITVKSRMQLSSSASGVATTAATAQSKVKAFPATVATAVTASGISFKYKPSASTTSLAAAGAISTRAKVIRSVAGAAVASGSSGSYKRAYRSAAATGQAVTAGSMLRKVRLGAQSSGSATLAAAIILSHRLSGSSSGVASATAFARRSITLIAAIAPQASGAAAYRMQRRVSISSTGAAVCAVSSVWQKTNYPGYATAAAQTSSGISIRLATGGFAVARAIANSAAADYGSAMPAPEERRMLVSASDRLMEVTT